MRYWETADTMPETTPVELEFALAWQRTPKVVFSTTLDRVGPNAKLVRGDVERAVQSLTPSQRRRYPRTWSCCGTDERADLNYVASSTASARRAALLTSLSATEVAAAADAARPLARARQSRVTAILARMPGQPGRIPSNARRPIGASRSNPSCVNVSRVPPPSAASSQVMTVSSVGSANR